MRQDSDDAQQIVLQLDHTQEHRPLDNDELHVRRVAKEKIQALAAMLRQRSKLTWIRARDSSKMVFHLRACNTVGITVAATVPGGYSSRNLFQRVSNLNLNSF
jgi:hypothetical protein